MRGSLLVFISPSLGSDDNPKSGGRVAGAFGGISCMNAVLPLSLKHLSCLLRPSHPCIYATYPTLLHVQVSCPDVLRILLLPS